MWSKMEDQATSSDYEYGDEWDWDKEDPRQYCHHGKFIGSWWGPDILCMDCEIGEDPTLNEILQSTQVRIDKYEMYIEYLKNIIMHTIDIIEKDVSGYNFLSDFNPHIEQMMNQYKKVVSALNNEKKEVYEKYIVFCEDPETDRDILYKIHRHEIKEFNRMKSNG